MPIKPLTIGKATRLFPRHDTATIVEVSEDLWLCAYHRFVASSRGGNDEGHAHGVVCKSFDRGTTWEKPHTCIQPDKDDRNIHGMALHVLPNRDILLIALACHSDACSSMRCYRSVDNGHTFVRESDIWHKHQGQWLQGGAAGIIGLASGRLLIPFHGGDGTQYHQHNRIHMAYSDDEGQPWHIKEDIIDLPKRGAMEPSVAQLPDGQLLMSIRSQLGFVIIARSDDHGLTWSEPKSTGLPYPESCTCLRYHAGLGRLCLLYNHHPYDESHHHGGPRSPLSLAFSHDGGQHWSDPHHLLSDSHAEYTNLNMTVHPNGDVSITYMHTPQAFNRDRLDLCSLQLTQQELAAMCHEYAQQSFGSP